MLEQLAKYHNDWLKIAYTFLQNKQDAEDMVHDIYIKLYDKGIKWKDIKHGNEVNRYFMYTVIRNRCLTFIKSNQKMQEFFENYQIDVQVDLIQDTLDRIETEMESWTYYDRHLFEVYMYSGLSLRDIANGSTKIPRRISNNKELCLNSVRNGTGISVSSMFHSIKKCKETLKRKIK